MRSHPPSPDDQAALGRRMALLGAELAAVRPQPELDPAGEPATVTPRRPLEPPPRPWWDEHTRLSEGTRGARGPGPGARGYVGGSDTARGAGGAVAVSSVSPAPGRHAARRAPGRDDRALGGEGWPPAGSGSELGFRRGRLLLGPAQLAVVAVVVMMALGVTCWWLARGRPSDTVQLQAAPVAGLTAAPSVDESATGAASGPDAARGADAVPASVASGSASSAPGSAAATSGATSATAKVTVDVSGKVRHPGIQVLPSGARVADALAAAGGPRPGVDLTALNLAQVLADGQQVLVGVAPGDSSSITGGSPGSGTTSAGGPTSGSAATPVQVVDLNTASADQLDTLPDVGPVTAQSILTWRQEHGRFSSVDELLEVDGIGEVTLGKIAPYVTV